MPGQQRSYSVEASLPGVKEIITEEGRAASKSPHLKFGYFLSMSQQAASADIIPTSAVGIFSQKKEGTKTLADRLY